MSAMGPPDTFSVTRYLAAKRSVDDRALNLQVWRALDRALARGTFDAPTRILEIGAGIGTMLERMVKRRLLDHAVYSAIDADPTCVAEMRRRHAEGHAEPGRVKLETEAIALADFVQRERGRGSWDLLVASAVLDLLDLPSTLPLLLSLARPAGLLYLAVNFDGATILEPVVDPVFDAEVEALYHRTMDERVTAGRPSGDSRCGRHLFAELTRIGVEILAAGSSDWVVFAGSAGYPGDERYFLHHVIHTMEAALSGHRELDGRRLAEWVATRHAQVEAGTLVFVAHQLDFLCRAPA